MAKSTSAEGDWGRWTDAVCAIFALLFVFFEGTNLQGGQTAALRGRGVPGYPLVGNNDGGGKWKDFGDALAMPSASGDLRIPANIDPKGQYTVPIVGQLPAIQAPIQNIDADNAAAADADLDMWLLVAEVANLPRQIEREEANMMVKRHQVLSSVAESGVPPSSLVDDVAAGAMIHVTVIATPQHLPPQTPVPEIVAVDATAPESIAVDTLAPEVVGILADVLPQRIEDEDEAYGQAQVEVEVAIEAFPPGMLELISNVARLPQFATASMTVPAGDLESNLEGRMVVDHPEAGDSSAELQAAVNAQDDVENLEVKEPHAKGMQ